MKKPVYLIVLFLLTLYSCKKDHAYATDESEQLKLLTSRPWRPVLVDRNPASNPKEKILYSATAQCKLDNKLTFDKNNQLFVDVGSVSCGIDDKDQTVAYKVDFAAKKITINGAVFKIAEISKSRFKYYSDLPYVTGYTALVYIFEH